MLSNYYGMRVYINYYGLKDWYKKSGFLECVQPLKKSELNIQRQN